MSIFVFLCLLSVRCCSFCCVVSVCGLCHLILVLSLLSCSFCLSIGFVRLRGKSPWSVTVAFWWLKRSWSL